jgi:hypothetical protein
MEDVAFCFCNTTTSVPTPPTPISEADTLRANMRAVEAELLRLENYEWNGEDVLGTVNLVEFWKVRIDTCFSYKRPS